MRKTVRRASRALRRGAVLGVSAVLAVSLGLAGCSGDDEPESTPSPAAPSASPTVATRVSFGKVAGKLPAAQRKRLADDVRAVVDGWLDAAYLGGDYPRTRFAGSWPGFTAGAAAKARHDARLMSNQDIGARIDGVEPLRRAVRLDVLAAKRRPVGVTAHVGLRFATTGARARRIAVDGRLFLTRGQHGWRVFGYDVTKGAVR